MRQPLLQEQPRVIAAVELPAVQEGVFYASDGKPISLGARIGAGGEGTVYDVAEDRELVAKIYHQPLSDEKSAKLLTLAQLGNERLFKLTAWPVDVLRPQLGGPVVGFLMNKVAQAEEVHALHSPKSRLQKFPEASWAFLVHVAANIARAVAVVHEHGWVIGDINPKNILVTKKATVSLLDCDSFQITARDKTYFCEGGFPEYTPPELQGLPLRELVRTPEHDRFGLAVVIFQLLFLGRHPFSGRFWGGSEMPLERAIKERRWAYGADAAARQMQTPPGALPLEAIPTALAELFRRAFMTDAPVERPTPREWIASLEALAQSLQRCSLHSGHQFYDELSDCPWCEIETRARVRLFNFLLGGNVDNKPFQLDELWREIEAIALPSTVTISKPEHWGAPLAVSRSPEVEVLVRKRRKLFAFSLLFAGLAGWFVGWQASGLGFGVLVLVPMLGAIHAALRNIDVVNPVTAQSVLQLQPVSTVSTHPVAKRIEEQKASAEADLAQLKTHWAKEASAERFLDKVVELRDKKFTYERLAQTREQKLGQTITAGWWQQCGQFLSQFEIRDAYLPDIETKVRERLFSAGVSTANDITQERLRKIPGVPQPQATTLLLWREQLQQQFAFDPGPVFTSPAYQNVEKEMDALHRRLEYELSSGPHYLRRIKEEIENAQRTLEPQLASARLALAQADHDWKAISKRTRLWPLIIVLILAFFFGATTTLLN